MKQLYHFWGLKNHRQPLVSWVYWSYSYISELNSFETETYTRPFGFFHLPHLSNSKVFLQPVLTFWSERSGRRQWSPSAPCSCGSCPGGTPCTCAGEGRCYCRSHPAQTPPHSAAASSLLQRPTEWTCEQLLRGRAARIRKASVFPTEMPANVF